MNEFRAVPFGHSRAVPERTRPPVLIVDDDPDIRRALSHALEREGYQIRAVATGAEAIDKVKASHYAAVLLDLKLPDLDGLWVLRILKKLDSSLPVIVLTAYASDENRIGSFAKGAFACIIKPYNLEEINAALQRAVEVKTLAVKAERAQHALTASEERFRSVVESATDTIVLADRTGTILSWNPAATRMFGYTEDEVVGRPLAVLMPARYREAHQHGMERVHATGECRVIGRTIELEGVRKDGTEFPLELSLGMWRTKEGTSFSGIIRDITERKRAEAALRESQERFRQLAENIREVFWMTDPQKNTMIYVSPGYEEIWGRECESLYESPRSWLDAIHPEDRPRVAESALTRQVTGEYDEEYRIVRRDGVIRWVRDRAFPIRNETGTVYRIAGVAADITERKEAQEALRHAYDTIEAIISSLPCSILIIDGLQRVTFANSSACERFSAGTFPLLGRRLAEVLPLRPPDWARLQEGLGGQAGCRREQEFELAGRVYRACQFPVSIREHSRTGLLLWDITEQKELQSQLIQAEKLASLGTMVSGMAHEINNPMHGILGMAELILDEDDPELMKEYARDIVAYSHHVATVVRDFACYARSASRDEAVDVDLNERLAESVKMVRRSPQFGRVEVITSFQPLPCLRARKSEIDQVLVNLISNAAQAMDGKGRLTLTTRLEDGKRIVMISDTGCGIPKALLPKIFEPFFTTKVAGKGTGLGLSIAHKIVTKYGGSISVESDEGKGTTFTLQFSDPKP